MSQPQTKMRRPGVAERLQLWSADRRHVNGLWIGVSNVSNRPSGEILDRVEEALTVIRSYDPRRYGRWVRLQVAGNLGSYNHYSRTCELDLRYVLREGTVPADLASTLVHEATHARLAVFGYSEPIRARVEAACRGQERAFAERLPQPEGDRIRAKLKYWDGDAGDWFSKAARERQYVEGIPAALEYVGIPMWLAPVITFGRTIVLTIRRLAGGLTGAWSGRGHDQR